MKDVALDYFEPSDLVTTCGGNYVSIVTEE